MATDTPTIQEILQLPYDRQRWGNLLHQVFPGVSLFQVPQQVTDGKPDYVEDYAQVGSVRLADGKSLTIFEIRVADKVNLLRNRVGLRDLVARHIDQGRTHGVLCIFSSSSPEYRFTFVCKDVSFDDQGAIITQETNPSRYTYILGPGETRRTASLRFDELARHKSEAGIKEVTEAFSVERLNKEFFESYKVQYQRFVDHLLSTDAPKKVFGIEVQRGSASYDDACKPVRDYVKGLLGRIVFLHFVQKKGWLGCSAGTKRWTGGDPDFIRNLFGAFKNKEKFHSSCLAPLFFDALNTPDRPGDIFSPSGTRVPYLNGGLFEETLPNARHLDFPAGLFDDLLAFFSAYNFAIDENDPEEHEVGIDPEMLGHIFENLLEENKDKGAYYTPKEVVKYMCQESLLRYLQTHLGEQEGLASLVRRKDPGPNDKANWVRMNAASIESWLDKVTICDPAIGSGAFPIGMLHEIFWIKLALDWTLNDPAKFAEIKRKIIEYTIHGVDLDPGAVEIARLRCWLSLVVDEVQPRPLPNLDFKIHCANSIIEYIRGEPVNLLKHEKLDPAADRHIKNLEVAKQALFEASRVPEKRSARLAIYSAVIELGKLEFTWMRTQEGLFSSTARAAELDSALDVLALFSNRLASAEKLSVKKQDELLEELLQWFDDSGKPTFAWRIHFAEVFGNGGFDILIANPPYVRQESFLATKHLLKAHYSTYTGTADLYTYFYERSIRLLKDNGVLVFITSDKFHRADFGEKLRAFINKNLDIVKLIDFRDVPVFDAIAYASILLGSKSNSAGKGQMNLVRWCNGIPIGKLNSGLTNFEFPRDRRDFASNKWTIETKRELSIYLKITAAGINISSFYGTKLYYGLKTGLNQAFVISKENAHELMRQDESARAYLTPIIQGKTDLNPWTPRSDLSYLVNIGSSENVSHPWSTVSENRALKIFKASLPSIYNWLMQFEDKIKGRSDQGRFFWELRSCTYWNIFCGDKVIVPTLSKEPVAVFDPGGLATNDKTTICSCDKPLLLATLMHCDLIWWQLTRISAIRQNNYFEIKDMYLSELILPKLSAEDVRFFEEQGREIISKETEARNISSNLTLINNRLSEIWQISTRERETVQLALANDFIRLL